jgi:hypothetical protein
MLAAATLAAPRVERAGAAACERCGQAIDSRHFDASGFEPLPERGREALLARCELAPQYCGLLEFFAQFTDAHARDASQVETPGLRWLLLVNRQVLDPYVELEQIVNPWGYGSFQLAVRLPEGATVELIVRRALAAPALPGVARIGGRLAGRYWYDASFGSRNARRGHGSAS